MDLNTMACGMDRMAQTREFQRGDLIFCDLLKLASSDWEIAIEGGNLLGLQDVISSWPRALSVVVEHRPTLRVVKIYIIPLRTVARSPYNCLFNMEE